MDVLVDKDARLGVRGQRILRLVSAMDRDDVDAEVLVLDFKDLELFKDFEIHRVCLGAQESKGVLDETDFRRSFANAKEAHRIDDSLAPALQEIRNFVVDCLLSQESFERIGLFKQLSCDLLDDVCEAGDRRRVKGKHGHFRAIDHHGKVAQRSRTDRNFLGLLCLLENRHGI